MLVKMWKAFVEIFRTDKGVYGGLEHMKGNRIATIGRQIGSGGGEVGMEVAETSWH